MNLITEDNIINWVNENNGLLITRNIVNFRNINDYNGQNIICITGYDSIIQNIFKIIDIFYNPFILIILETDFFKLTEDMLNQPLLKHIYCWNKPFDHEKITAIPIGLNHSRQYDSLINWKKENKINLDRDKLLCINFSPETNSIRGELIKKCKNEWNNFCDIFKYIPNQKSYWKQSNIEGKILVNVTNPLYYHLINKYKFVLSPPGAGPDCHRTWEALYMGCIPIVISSSIDELYEDLPILVINDWNEINNEFLEKKIIEIMNKNKNGEYNINKLYLQYWLDKINNNCKINQKNKYNIHFITYGDNNFVQSKKRILNEANEFGEFKTIKGYGPEDLSEDFKEKYKEVLNMPRGGGYWIWKLYIINDYLKNIGDNEYLIYLDAGSTINKQGKRRFFEYIDKLKNSENHYGILSFQMSGNISDYQKEKWWTTSNIFEYFGVKPDSDIGKSGQYISTLLIMKKNKHLINILEKYENCISDDPLLITDIYNENQYKDFKDNRHDQSIFSILRKIHGSEVIDDETWIVPFGGPESMKYPFWATRLRG